jgi:hypothetical protein
VSSAPQIQREPWPGNAEGQRRFTIPTMARFIREDGQSPEMRAFAGQVLRDAGFPASAQGKAEALLEYVRRAVGYVNDPAMTEMVQRAKHSLCVGDNLCIPIGDCDDKVVALGALMRAAGLDVKILSVTYGGGAQDHVSLSFLSDNGRWLEADPTTTAPIGAASPGRKVAIDPLAPDGAPAGEGNGIFVGVGRPGVGYSQGMVSSTHEAIFGRRIGAGFVTPGDILAYRAMWDQYVLDTCRAAIDCGQAMQQIASQNPQNSESATVAQLGASFVQSGNDLLAKWNVYAGQSASSVVVNGADILQNEQQVVLEAGQLRGSLLAGPVSCGPVLSYHDANGNVVQVVAGPDASTQTQVIARIEGLGILGSGILQILLQTAAGTLRQAGSATEWAAKLAGGTASWLLSPWTWGIAATILVGSVALIVWKADKVAQLVQAARPV